MGALSVLNNPVCMKNASEHEKKERKKEAVLCYQFGPLGGRTVPETVSERE